MSHSPAHEVKRPVAQFYDPNSGDKAPLAALLAALSKAPNHLPGVPSVGHPKDAAITARLCSALSLQRDSLLSNIHQNKTKQGQAPDHLQFEANTYTPTGNSSSQQPFSISPHDAKEANEVHFSVDGNAEVNGRADREQSSTEMYTNPSLLSEKSQQPPLSEEAKKKRRQEINRESARRVRKRKTEAHVQLQEEVIGLKAAASSAAADQAVIVRYASELTKERDALLQRSITLENKWIAAECRNVILRQRIADLTGKSLQDISSDTGQFVSNSLSEQQTHDTAPESSTHFHPTVKNDLKNDLDSPQT